MDKIKKILLVVPPGTSHVQPDGTKQCKECPPPLGLAYLASELKASGQYDVRVYDMVVEGFWKESVVSKDTVLYGSSFEQYLELLEEYKPDLVGIQCMLSSRSHSALELCRITKGFNNEIVTVLGGHHAAALPEHVLQKDTDFVVLGEADHSFPELVNCLNKGGNIFEINGIAYRQDKKLIAQERRDFIKDLDDLPFPAWDIVGLEKYWTGVIAYNNPPKKKKYGVMNTSRGCPHSCHYCAVPCHTGEGNYRERDLSKVFDEIRWLVDVYGVEEIQFTDDNFFVNKRRIKELCRFLIANFPDMY
ncbi:B12-binding domain-containing radical SAM protein, partial [Candidatus Omnitrophota bacterium]